MTVMSGAVVRGDNEPIVIGDDTNIQENCVLHTDLDRRSPRQGRDGGPPGDAARLHDRRWHLDRHPGRGAQQLVVGKDCLVGAGAVIIETRASPTAR